jgi:organic hydroperoxide reductase OsmC/OhrA
MSRHDVVIEWQAEGDFARGQYSRAHVWRFDGGAEVHASSSPHVVPVPLSDPAGVDPEEALIASASSCHMLWFLDLARRAGLIVERYRDDAQGIMGRDDRGRMALLTIWLRPEITFSGRQPSAGEVEALHHEAHRQCFIANSLRTEILVEAPVRAAS